MKKKIIVVLCAAIIGSTTIPASKVFAEENNYGGLNLSWEAAGKTRGFTEFSGIYTGEVVQGQGISYYVSNDGSDSNDGKSEDKPYRTVKKAMEALKAGDTLYLREGTYSEQINVTKSGTKDNYITIKPYPGEEVILDYSNTKITTGINIDSKSYVTVEGLTIQNITETSADSAVGILVCGTSSNINIKNCTLTNIKAKSTKGNANVILVAGNSTKAPVSNIRVEGNKIYNCVCGWSESLTVNGNSQYVDVINNRIDNVGNIGIDIAGSFGVCSDSSLDQARYVYVAGNVVSNSNSPNARSAGIYADGSRNVWFNGNTVYNSQSGIEVAGESKGLASGSIVVSNNLLYNNSQVSMIFGAYEPNTGVVKNIEVYNNTVYHTGSDQVIEVSIIDGLKIKNNIFYSTSNVKILDSGSFSTSQVKNLNFDNNVVYGLKSTGIYYNKKSYTLKDFSKLLNGENIEKDPMFINVGTDFSLSPASPCIDKGDNDIEIGRVDILGNNRIVNGIDIGAYEFIEDEIIEDDTTNDDEIDNGTTDDDVTDDSTDDNDSVGDDTVNDGITD